MSFGRMIKLRRKVLDLTQEDLAHRVGYSVITIRKVESNERRPSRQLAERLARALDLGSDELEAFVGFARAGPGLLARAALAPRALPRPAYPVGNMVTPLTRLVGREAAVAAVRGMLTRPDVRLVTLVGPPGIGKSRLAMQVALEMSPPRPDSSTPAFDDGVFTVALAPLRDPSLIPSAIAVTVGLKDLDATSLVESLISHLQDRRLLLVLDNFEHVNAGAPTVARVLAACPGLRVLATGRAPLHLSGEHLYLVPPLALPGPGTALTADAALRFSAVELFVERAQAANPSFVLTDDDARAIAEICARVDGLPLSIELVAARSRLLTPAMLLARLDRRLPLLTDGPQDLPLRQQTLRAALDWSYELLDPAEQELFAWAAVFPGGCTIEAADNVIGPVRVPDGRDLQVFDGLAALVDKNLMRDEIRGGEPYFVMLETIREYALERLADAGAVERARCRLANYVLALAEEAGPYLNGAHQEEWFARLDAEQNNVRAVLDWYAARQLAEPGVRFIAALWRYWHVRSQTDVMRAVRAVLALDRPDELDGSSARARALALYGAGWMAMDHNDAAAARDFFDESLALFRVLDDRRGVAEALHGVATMAQAEERHEEAARLLRESHSLHRELDDEEGIAWSLDHLALQALDVHEYDRAYRLSEEALGLFQRQNHAWGTAILYFHVGVAALARDDPDVAEQRFEQAMLAFRELANNWGLVSCSIHLGFAALAQDDHETAAGHLTQALSQARSDTNVVGMAGALCGLASLALARVDHERAAYLLGAVETIMRLNRARTTVYERTRYATAVTAVTTAARRDAGGVAVSRALDAGRQTSLTTVVSETLDQP
jgi:predicted ATPase/transcriptional regulator with XRE-family HTH domain